MTPASKSLYYFGLYLLLTGLTLIVSPNTLLSLFQMPETTEVWIRVTGTVVISVGLFYTFMAPANHKLFMMLTVYGRLAILVWFTAFVVLDLAPVQLIIFGVVDAVGAIWTYSALKKG